MKKYLLSMAALLIMTGCSHKTGSSTVSPVSSTSEIEETATPTPEETSTPQPEETPQGTPEETPEETPETSTDGLFQNGTWSADDGEELTRYFIIRDGSSGREIDVENKMGIDFTYVKSDGQLVFMYGDPDNSVTADVEIEDDKDMVLTWEYGVVENLRWISADESITFYSSRELGDMALDYYEEHNDYRPEYVAWINNLDGTVTLQLYDNMGDHNSTSAWYTIDRFSGKGTDDITNTEIDITQ